MQLQIPYTILRIYITKFNYLQNTIFQFLPSNP
jgi:hypothetical protein